MIIADLAVMPFGSYKDEDEMYEIVDACIELIKQSGLKYEIGAMSTTIEGEFDDVFKVIKEAHKLPFKLNCKRVITVARIDERKGGLSIKDKLKNYR